MLLFNLKAVMQRREIEDPLHFLVKQGFTYHAAHRLMHLRTGHVPTQHLSKLCECLRCTPNELFCLEAGADERLAADHPLQALKARAPEGVPLRKVLLELPLEKIEEVRKLVEGMRGG